MSEFYDENAELLNKKARYTERLLWLKIQHCYELCLGYSQYEDEKEEIMGKLEADAKAIVVLMKKIEMLEKRIESMIIHK